MSEPFVAEVKMVGFAFAPRGWAFCDGQILPIDQNPSLYSILGTNYGGDGQTNFALPDLRGRTPIHVGSSGGGSSHPLGENGGEETHALSAAEMPQHGHVVQASSASADAPTPQGNVLAAANDVYHDVTAPTGLRAGTLAATGGGQAHENEQPYLVVNFCIALQGLLPSRD